MIVIIWLYDILGGRLSFCLKILNSLLYDDYKFILEFEKLFVSHLLKTLNY